jgi:hypothetical protein
LKVTYKTKAMEATKQKEEKRKKPKPEEQEGVLPVSEIGFTSFAWLTC